MYPNQLLTALKVAEKSGVSTLISGPPGIGKSQITYQFAKQTGRAMTEIRPAQWDQTDVKGIPDFINNELGERCTAWTRPEYLPTAPHSILLIEELDKAAPAVQAALLELVLDKRIGKYRLAEDCFILACCNRMEDRSGSFAQSKALGSRFQHLKLEPSNDDWEKWALAHGIRIDELAYLRWKPEHLHQFDPTQKSPAFPCPRQWELLNLTLNAMDEIGPETDAIRQEEIAGHIGPEIGAEFHAFALMFMELPDPRKIDKDPDGTGVPLKTNARYAVTTALARTATAANVGARIKYIGRITDGQKNPLKEFQVIFARDLTALKSPALSTPEFTAWILANSDFLGA